MFFVAATAAVVDTAFVGRQFDTRGRSKDERSRLNEKIFYSVIFVLFIISSSSISITIKLLILLTTTTTKIIVSQWRYATKVSCSIS